MNAENGVRQKGSETTLLFAEYLRWPFEEFDEHAVVQLHEFIFIKKV